MKQKIPQSRIEIYEKYEVSEDKDALNLNFELKDIDKDPFQIIFQASPTGMSLSTYKQGKLLKVNQAWLDLIGLSQKEDVIGKTTVELGLVPDVETREMILSEFTQSDYVKNLEILSHIKNGSRINLRVKKKMFQISGRKYILSTVEDITEFKHTEEKLNLSKMIFSGLVEHAPFGIYVIDSKFRFVHVNLRSLENTFKNVKPIIGRDFAEVVNILWPEPVAEGVISIFRHTLKTGEPYYTPAFFNHRKDIDKVEAYEWELRRIKLDDGKYGVICYYFDATMLKEIEVALLDSEEKYRTIVETANEGIWIVDENRKTTYVNFRMASMLGYTIDEMMTKHWQSFVFETEERISDLKIGEISGFDQPG